MFRRVLVPVDFSPCSVQAASHACALVRAIGGHLTLLHVLEDAGEVASQAEARLRPLADLARRPPALLLEDAGGHPVAAVILEAARRTRAELLVLGPHGGPDPTVRRLGQVATEVLLSAQLPVQLIPGILREATGPGARWRALAGDRREN